MDIHISPSTGLRGTIFVSTDKSISHRALMLAAISKGMSVIHNLSDNADVRSTKSCLQQLGINIAQEGSSTIVHGVGIHGFKKPNQTLDAGNSGTTMRLLTGLLAGQKFNTVITGDSSLIKRPMKRIITPLRIMGASLDASETGTAPLVINGRSLNPIHYHSPVASAQVKSTILLAGLHATGRTSVTEPFKSRDHTERMLPDFGIPVDINELTVSVTGPAKPTGGEITIPGDISSAAFFLVGAAIVPNSDLVLKNIGLNSTRTGIVDVLVEMGADISINECTANQNERIGEIRIKSSHLNGIKINAPQIPKLIDELPVIAIAAAHATGKTTVSGAGELRIKESDRLKAISENLRAMGIHITEMDDGFEILGPQSFKGATLPSFADHRIAMAFAIAGLTANSQTCIRNADCVNISMPHFFKILETIKKQDI